VLGLATAGTAIALAKQFVRPSIAGLAGLLILIGPQVEAWARLGPQEAYAMPLALGGLALLVRGRTMGAPFIIAAALTKESYAILAVVALSRHRPVTSVVIGLILGWVAAVRLLGVDFYAQGRSPEVIAGTFVQMGVTTALVMLWPLVLAAVALLRAPFPWRWITVLTITVAVPQAMLYAGLSEGRYLLPAAIVPVAVTVLGLEAIRSRPIRSAIVGVILMTGAIATLQAGGRAWDRATAAGTFAAGVAAARATGAEPVIIPVDIGRYEQVFAIRSYLGMTGIVVPPPPPANPTELDLRLAADLARMAGPLPSQCVAISLGGPPRPDLCSRTGWIP
jgi:hypothetical protein